MKKVNEEMLVNIIGGTTVSKVECLAWGFGLFTSLMPIVAIVGFSTGRIQECWNS
jgi:hypothetical protein